MQTSVSCWAWKSVCGMKVEITNGGLEGDNHCTGDIGEIIRIDEIDKGGLNVEVETEHGEW